MELSCSKEAQIFRLHHEKRRRKLGEVHHHGNGRRYTHGRGRPRRAWSDDIKEWTHLSTVEALQLTKDRTAWRSVVLHAANVRASE